MCPRSLLREHQKQTLAAIHNGRPSKWVSRGCLQKLCSFIQQTFVTFERNESLLSTGIDFSGTALQIDNKPYCDGRKVERPSVGTRVEL